jgi:hypothetical protein
MEQENTQAQTAPVSEPQAQAPAAPDLNLSDLASLRSILEVASSRGAFKAAELEAVGKTFNKLNTFLESVATKKE